MVGHLGASASASIGLVSSSTWLIGGILTASAMGFSVCVAHRIGARDEKGARVIVKWGLLCCLLFSLLIMAIGAMVSPRLPVWMGGEAAIRRDASAYFLIYALSIPTREMLFASQGMIQSSGNNRVPSILNVIMCALDVFFNALLIPKFGVAGAALGTAFSFVIIASVMLYILLVRSPSLSIVKPHTTKVACFHTPFSRA